MARPKSLNPMEKITIFLPSDIKARLHSIAERYGLKDSHLARILIQFGIGDMEKDEGDALKKFLTVKNE